MGIKSFLGGNKTLILAVIVVVAGILFPAKLFSVFNTFSSFREEKVGVKNKVKNVFSETELSQYNGVTKKKIYLAVLGSVFDVTKGKRHYDKGGSYHYFVGKDGSRALITGNFNDESSNKDQVADLSCNELFALVHWKDTFKEKYKSVGVLIGRYYDDSGKQTEYSKEVYSKIEQCKTEKEIAIKDEQKYPQCNIEWSAEHGSRVWCSKSSGGVVRGWVGVPRQLYTPGEEKPRCVCVNIYKDNSAALLKEYDNCKPDSTSCTLDN